MLQLDPIIAVKDVETSSKWYQTIFGCKSMHNGSAFDILVSPDNEVLLCLHQWEQHGHPTMVNRAIPAGNGLILYIRTKNLDVIRQNVERINWPVAEDIHLNAKFNKKRICNTRPRWILSHHHRISQV